MQQVSYHLSNALASGDFAYFRCSYMLALIGAQLLLDGFLMYK